MPAQYKAAKSPEIQDVSERAKKHVRLQISFPAIFDATSKEQLKRNGSGAFKVSLWSWEATCL